MNYQELLNAVTARLDVVADHELRQNDPAAHLAELRKAASTLDRLVAGLPPDTDPTLRHYLERQSYLKAQEWLVRALREQG